MPPATRIMYIEDKSEGLVGPARIGRVQFSKTRKSVRYNGQTFQTLAGSGFKSNYCDAETGEDYWISGCKKDGSDALYSTMVDRRGCAGGVLADHPQSAGAEKRNVVQGSRQVSEIARVSECRCRLPGMVHCRDSERPPSDANRNLSRR